MLPSTLDERAQEQAENEELAESEEQAARGSRNAGSEMLDYYGHMPNSSDSHQCCRELETGEPFDDGYHCTDRAAWQATLANVCQHEYRH